MLLDLSSAFDKKDTKAAADCFLDPSSELVSMSLKVVEQARSFEDAITAELGIEGLPAFRRAKTNPDLSLKVWTFDAKCCQTAESDKTDDPDVIELVNPTGENSALIC